MESYQKTYQEWLNSSDFDEETKAELLKIQNNEKEIEGRFYKNLELIE